jgi:hypothetical protein
MEAFFYQGWTNITFEIISSFAKREKPIYIWGKMHYELTLEIEEVLCGMLLYPLPFNQSSWELSFFKLKNHSTILTKYWCTISIRFRPVTNCNFSQNTCLTGSFCTIILSYLERLGNTGYWSVHWSSESSIQIFLYFSANTRLKVWYSDPHQMLGKTIFIVKSK